MSGLPNCWTDSHSLCTDEKTHYAARDPITALKKYIIEQNLGTESELKSIEKKIDDVVEEAVEFADASPHPPRSQLLENVFADPKGFGIGPDGKYRCEDPKFTQGTAQVWAFMEDGSALCTSCSSVL